jgi:hypothetical protein
MQEAAESVSYNSTPKNARGYYRTLCDVMGLKDGRLYDKNIIFSKEHLLTLTPSDICKFFCLKVYGCEVPDGDAKPTQGRSTSLESYKKNISYFMPNRLMAWNVGSQQENPTQSVSVNELIKNKK